MAAVLIVCVAGVRVRRGVLQSGAAAGEGEDGVLRSAVRARCLPLHIMKLLSSDRQREWWDAVYSLIHKRAQ